MHHPPLSLIKTISLFLVSAALALAAPSPIQERADRFLALANAGYKGLYRVNSEAQWAAVTDVTPAHDAASETAGKAEAAFNGNPALINEARYYSYAVATVLKFQLHDHIARKILHQPPQACNYVDNKEIGAFFKKIMEKGGTEDWRKVLKDATGEELSTRAMVESFKPLQSWLETQNKGRQIGWD